MANLKSKVQRIHGIPVYGVQVDQHAKCTHYHSAVDIVAIKFKCCGLYYACYWCHEPQQPQHAIERWDINEFHEKAILCAACGSEMTIQEYLDCESQCPDCAASFNARCAFHWHFYFEELPS